VIIQYLVLKLSSICLMTILLIPAISVSGQEKPPKPITVAVDVYQYLEFGTVIQAGSYGTVYISKTGSRSVSGSVYEKSSTFTPALFFVTALPGTLITISSITSLGLKNGLNILPLSIDKNIDTSSGSQFICTTGTTSVYVGGTLTVNSLITNPAGQYTGTFTITFIQQ
jgi:Domain of unknown function (DUF4402)